MYHQRARRASSPLALLFALLALLLLGSLPGAVATAAPTSATVPASMIVTDTTWRRADSPIDVTSYITEDRDNAD